MIMANINNRDSYQENSFTRGKKVKKHVTSTDKVSNGMWKNEIPTKAKENYYMEQVKVLITGGDKGKPVASFVTLTSENFNLFKTLELTPYDRAVHDAVLSLMLANNDLITDEMILSTINGQSSHDMKQHTDAQLQEIRNSMYKMQSLKISIDVHQEASVYKFDGIKDYKFIGNLVPCEIIECKAGGKLKVVYRMFDTPPLYRYSKAKNQIAENNLNIFNIPNLKMTKDLITVQTVLYHAVLARTNKNSKIYKQKLLFDSIYTDAHIDFKECSKSAAIKKRQRLNKNIIKILDYWSSEKGGNIIKNYKEIYSHNNKSKLEGVILL